jgi:hypothetical protein
MVSEIMSSAKLVENYLNTLKYRIEVWGMKGESNRFKLQELREIKGIEHTLSTAEKIIDREMSLFFKDRRMTATQKRKLRADMRFDFPAWYITIERISAE